MLDKLATSTQDSAEHRAADAAIAQASIELATRQPGIPKTFVGQLFARVVPEDVVRYDAAQLALLAERAWQFLDQRNPGEPKIRCETVPIDTTSSRSITVIEVINDDMPFLFDSVMGEIAEHRLDVRFVAHPVVNVKRDNDKLVGLTEPGGGHRESFIHIHVEPISDDAMRAELVTAIEHILLQVRLAVADWRKMLERVHSIISDLKTNPPPLPVEEIGEAVQFLQWLADDHFTFLGMREYDRTGDALDPDFKTGLGVLQGSDLHILRRGDERLELTPELKSFFNEPHPLILAKTMSISQVHRRTFLDYVGVKKYDSDGNLIGEHRIVGLFTSVAYTRSARSIPYVRRKIAAIEQRAGFVSGSHSAKALANVLEQFPRDELFQVDSDTLYDFATAIMRLDERPRVRVLARRDRFDRFVSVLAYVPRDRYGSAVRERIGAYLAQAFGGEIASFVPFFPEGPLVRVHYIISRAGGDAVDVPREVLEREVSHIVRSWTDSLAEALNATHAPEQARALFARYRDAFSQGFHDYYAASSAASDIRAIETLTEDRPLAVDFRHRSESEQDEVNLKVWSYGRPLPLSERVPVLEAMGFLVVDERTYRIAPENSGKLWFHDMLLRRPGGGAVDLQSGKARLESAFLNIMRGIAENDGYNALTLNGGLGWRDVSLIRTLSRYLRQIRVSYSQDYMWATLVKHAAIASDIVELFHARFDPRDEAAKDRDGKQQAIAARIDEALEKVDSLDEDRILRLFVNAVQSAIRTNYFQTGKDGHLKPLIAIKFESGKLTEMPLPRPLYEIFVYSPRVEGIHMRFGKVARGGLRWSDRPQDFRTEILGLVKAQQVKNAVIVPVGAKGGFVPKQMPANPTRDQFMAEGIATYKLFIGSLLEITDNYAADGSIIPPDCVVRYEGDDPYLVVAADKGTATFSDIANGLALEHGFWLGDAFASGGSVGYDHKVMGITARGAWESVKRHFREMDINIHETPFTAIGVGDMSGDVFGNGMLREDTTKLVAAFDHRDIFIDPNPDPKASFAERQRLFNLPRSSWQDYDKSLLSQGGGIYPRSSKEIRLSPEAQKLIGVGESVTPQALMKAILKMQADLLFFGGIGTYVRSSHESDADAGDRSNDAIRITGSELRVKVVGEGANLGMTQRGRIEAALNGVRLNTDAIDNSAGVNTSDVEVNIKIAYSSLVRAGQLTLEQRNGELVEMTDDVAKLVLRNNYQQTLALSLAQRRGLEDLGFQQRLMQTLEQRGLLDRAVEYLPDEVTLADRRKRNQPLTRPELAVLLAYAKLTLYSELLETSVPDDPFLGREINRYFPPQMSAHHADALQSHRLRREIIATQLTNSMINRGGATLIVRIADQTGATPAAIAAAFAAVRNSYELIDLNGEIDALDNKITGEMQLSLYAAVQDLLLDRLVWFLRNVDLKSGLEGVVQHYREGIAQVEAALDSCLPKAGASARDARIDELKRGGVPEHLAQRIANLALTKAAPDIVMVADRAKQPVADVTATYFATEAFFQLDKVASAVPGIVVSDYFDRLALDRAVDQIGDAERRLTSAMVGNGHSGSEAVEAWLAPRKAEVERIRAAIHEIAGSGLTLSKLSVAASLLGDLARE